MTTPVTIYTDGGAMPNPGPGGWGALLIAESGHIRELSGSAPDTTNNRMELTAAIEALRALNQPCEVTLYTDSQYMRNGITSWLESWQKRGWTTKSGQSVQNRDLWEQLLTETERHTIQWKWVKGHAGNTHNERVDRLATAAREQLTGPAPAAPDAPTAPVQFEIALRVSATPKSSGWAVRIHDTTSDEMTTLSGRERGVSANALGLLAARHALETLPTGAAARVYCANDYVWQGVTQWVAGWQSKGWRTKSGSAVKNRDLWQALIAAEAKCSIDWTNADAPAWAKDLPKIAAEARDEP